MFSPYVSKKAITVREVYGVADPTIPRGYKALAFKEVEFGEYYLNTYGNVVQAPKAYKIDFPRIIVEKLKTRRITFETTGRTGFAGNGPGEYVFVDDQKASPGPWPIYYKVSDELV